MSVPTGSCGYNVGILAVNVILCVCICNLFNIHIATYVTPGHCTTGTTAFTS